MGTRVKNHFTRPILLGAVALFITSCEPDAPDTPPTPTAPAQPAISATPAFDADSAYAFVAEQVGFGPRVPGTKSHIACGDWMVQRLKSAGANVIEQTGTVMSFNNERLPLRNIIGQFHPERKERILLLAHWDTRPFADKDDERTNQPIDGANDGGSGVGILLEIARHLSSKEHGPGIDILFQHRHRGPAGTGADAGLDRRGDLLQLLVDLIAGPGCRAAGPHHGAGQTR